MTFPGSQQLSDGAELLNSGLIGNGRRVGGEENR